MTSTCTLFILEWEMQNPQFFIKRQSKELKLIEIIFKLKPLDRYIHFIHWNNLFILYFRLSMTSGESWQHTRLSSDKKKKKQPKTWGNFRCRAVAAVDARGQHSIRDHLLLQLTRATRVRGGRPRFYFGLILNGNPHKYSLCINVKRTIVRSFVFFTFTFYVYICSLHSSFNVRLRRLATLAT